jgi:hypothetical protein
MSCSVSNHFQSQLCLNILWLVLGSLMRIGCHGSIAYWQYSETTNLNVMSIAPRFSRQSLILRSQLQMSGNQLQYGKREMERQGARLSSPWELPNGSYCGSRPCTQDVVHCERSKRSVGNHVVSVDFTVQLLKKAVTLQPRSRSCALSKSNWTPWVAWHWTRNFSLHWSPHSQNPGISPQVHTWLLIMVSWPQW